MQLIAKFTAAEVNAIIEAERRGEFQLPPADYNDKTLAKALDKVGWDRRRRDAWQNVVNS